MLTHPEWNEIYTVIKKMIGDLGEPFVQATVIKSDAARKVVFCKEFGDVPIPIFAHYYQVKYTYKDNAGRTIIQKTPAYSPDVEVLVPKVGDIVLIAQHLGSRSLPKCIGVLFSKNFVQPE